MRRGGKEGGRGGVSRIGSLVDVQGRDDCRHWMAQIAIGVDHVLPFHPCTPVLRCVGDWGTNWGRR